MNRQRERACILGRGRGDLVRSLLISALVGTILVIVNQAPGFFLTSMSDPEL